jgi:hypothetical protein
MPFLNRLTEAEFRGAERVTAWLLTLFGYFVAMGMAIDQSGWGDPVFNTVRRVPYTPFSWALVLALSTFIFNIGYVLKHDNHWRGKLIIIGASLCATWWLAMAICMSRMVYEEPTRITDLWPLVAFFAACMYLSRVIVYANVFSGDRWNTHPYQLWSVTFLMLASLSQVIIGIAPVSVLSEIERPAALTVGVGNLFGAVVVMFGLHLRDKEQGLMYELAGSFSLLATLGWYCASVLSRSPLAGTTLGFAMPEAFVFATLHRGIQTVTLVWARYSNRGNLERRMIHALNPTGRPTTADSLGAEVISEEAETGPRHGQ